MLETFHLRAQDYQSLPWKNGKGKTTEIAKDKSDPFLWRLSLASLLSSGPFSKYEGYDRILVVLGGPGIGLIHEGKKERSLSSLVSYRFSGDVETTANVTEACEDFNVLSLRKKTKAGVYPTYIGKNEDLQFPLAGNEHFIFCLSGEITLHEANENKSYTLKERETFWFSRKTKKEFLNIRARGVSERAVCLWIVIHSGE